MARDLEQLLKQYGKTAAPDKKGGMPGGPGRGPVRGGPRGAMMGGKPKNMKNTVSRLLKYVSRYKALFVVVFFCLIITTVMSALGTYFLKPILDNLAGSGGQKDFAGKFNANTPIADIYDIYKKTQPKKEFKTMGSMKNSTSDDGTVKDFYTRDEALQFTKKDFDKNPALFKAVEASMLKW